MQTGEVKFGKGQVAKKAEGETATSAGRTREEGSGSEARRCRGCLPVLQTSLRDMNVSRLC